MVHRQTTIFGTIAAVLAFLTVLCTLFWLGVIPFPFNREFSRDPYDVTFVPCAESAATATSPSAMQVNVYNSSNIEGLAGKVSEKLTSLGVNVAETSNWQGTPVYNSVALYTGEKGVNTAYSLRAYLPHASIIYDHQITTATVDVVVSGAWNEAEDFVAEPDEQALEKAMESLKDCTPAADIEKEFAKN